MWKRYLQNAIALGGDGEFVAVHTSTDGVDDGFVHYAVKWKEERYLVPQGEGEVYDLWGTDPGVELALWDYLCNVDLVREWYAEERPVDDVVQFAVARSPCPSDALHVGRAVAAPPRRRRRARRPHLRRRRRLVHRRRDRRACSPRTAAPGRSRRREPSASPTDGRPRAADLAVTVTDLAAAYLGGTKWTALAGAGRIDVRDSRALALADALFGVPWAPFCCSGF